MKRKWISFAAGSLGVLLMVGVLVAQQQNEPQVSPSEPGTIKGVKHQMPTPEIRRPRQIQPLKVDRLEAVKLGDSSHIGSRGEYFLVVHGQGFFETEYTPILHLGKEVQLNISWVNKRQNELYVFLPRLVIRRLPNLNISEIRVQNPGGLNTNPKRWESLRLGGVELVEIIESATQADLRVAQNHIELQR